VTRTRVGGADEHPDAARPQAGKKRSDGQAGRRQPRLSVPVRKDKEESNSGKRENEAGQMTAAAAPTAAVGVGGAVAVSVGSGEQGHRSTAASEGCRKARCSAQISPNTPASAFVGSVVAAKHVSVRVPDDNRRANSSDEG